MHRLWCISLLLLGSLGANAYRITQCYWGSRQQLPSGKWRTGDAYVPCGEIEDGFQSCCRVGHNCLEANACYAPEVGMVYTAGCTDFEYKSDKCPSKCDSDAYWVGHSYCNGTSNQWSCCPNQFGNSDNEYLFPFNNKQSCWCPEDYPQIGFNAPSVIPSVGLLDIAMPSTISYFPGYGPSTTRGPSSTSTSTTTTSSDEDSSTTSTASTTERTQSASSSSTDSQSPPSQISEPSSTNASPSSSPSPESELSTPSKIGIGVGVGAGAIGLLALLWFLLTYLRKHNHKPVPPIEDQIRPKSFGSYAAMTEALKSPAWSGHKSELPADESVITTVPSPMIGPSTQANSVAEVEGTTPGQIGQSQSQSQLPRENVPSQALFGANGVKQYKPYNPAHRHGRSTSGSTSEQLVHEMPG